MPRAAPLRRRRSPSPPPSLSTPHSPDYSIFSEMEDKRARCERPWRFLVSAPDRVRPDETVCIVGDCKQLGSWSPSAIIPMVCDPSTNLWSVTVQLPADQNVHYRYCISMLFGDPPKFMISSWETSLRPRLLHKNAIQSETPDSYGNYDGHFKVDRGWLTTESVLQLKFYKNPFTFKSNIKDGTLRVKLIPVNFQFNSEACTPVDESLNADTNDGEPPMYVFTEVATINSQNPKFQPQEQFGRLYNEGDFIIFNIKCPNLHALAYLVDFYKHSSRSSPGDPPRHLGSCYILPNVLKKTEGQIELPITCSSKHRPLGSMNCEYLMVRPMIENLCDMSSSYVTHWNEKWRGLDVGHRGSGSSFKNQERPAIRENTIASLKMAAASGADLIEFDVQLSKDLIPVVYHDFHVCIALKRKKQIEYSEMLEIPMQDLTLEQLQKLKVYHVVEGRSNQALYFDDDLAEHQPFPLLSEVLHAIDPHVGFNIEIKGTTPLEDGTMELEHPFDLNMYLDKILNVVLRSERSRKIVFSSFHPDICTMLRLKQNVYPTMFLTQGITSRYPSYRDIRCNTIPLAMNHALNTGLLGIVVHTEDLLRDSSQVRLVIDSGLIMFCWGEDNNNTDTIKYLKSLGLHAVIYDKLDQYSTKEVKESIFLVEAREAQKELIKIAEDNNENSNEIKSNQMNGSETTNSGGDSPNNQEGASSSQEGTSSS